MTHTAYQDPVQVRRAYKFLLRPTSKQVAALEACLEDHRQLYNAALEERREAWRMRAVSVSYGYQAVQLPAIRSNDPDGQGRWSAGSQQQTLRRLDKAFAAFFRRVKAGQKPGYPRFKGRGWFDTIEWPAEKNGARWDCVPHPAVTRVYLLGVGHVRVHQHRAVRGRIKMISVKRERNRWYVVLSRDDVAAQPLPTTGAVVGIDLGVASFLTTSDGDYVANPRPLVAAAGRLASAQQSLARKKRRSNRRRKAVAKVAALHAKVRRVRLDHAHKTALALVRDHDVIVHEALQVANMTRRPTPRPAGDGTWEPDGAAAKTGLNKSILDAGWGIFLRMLSGKAESASRVVIAVDPRHTSQRCAECGHVAAGNRITRARFRCLACGHEAHADVNAARNILRAGLALRAAEAA
jgi:putative transposase